MTDTGVDRAMRRATTSTHYEQAKRELELLASRLSTNGEFRLPAEDRLAEDLGFSRPTVRSALLAMQKEGKVLRLHGVGTFINRHALSIETNLAEDLPFLRVIERRGQVATVDIIRLEERTLPERVVGLLEGSASSRGVVIDRLFRASGRPAVFSRDHVPSVHVDAPTAELTAERSTFAFLRRWTNRTLRYSVAAIRAIPAPEHVAEHLAVQVGTPLLLLEHRHVDDHEMVIGVTKAYVNGDVIEFSVVRTGSEL